MAKSLKSDPMCPALPYTTRTILEVAWAGTTNEWQKYFKIMTFINISIRKELQLKKLAHKSHLNFSLTVTLTWTEVIHCQKIAMTKIALDVKVKCDRLTISDYEVSFILVMCIYQE